LKFEESEMQNAERRTQKKIKSFEPTADNITLFGSWILDIGYRIMLSGTWNIKPGT
jgi:hypothetical protein